MHLLSDHLLYNIGSWNRKCLASEEIDKQLGQLLYESNFSELSWDDVSINIDYVILHSSNGTLTNSEESESDTPKPKRINNNCDIENEKIACDAHISNGVIENGVLFGSVWNFQSKLWYCLKLWKGIFSL